MALTPTEQKSLLELKSRGYTFQEAMGFIASTRFGQESRVTRDLMEQQKQPERSFLQTVGDVFKDIPEDVSTGYGRMVDAASAGMDTADEARTQVEQEEISPLAGTAKTIGAGLSAGVGVVGSAFQTLMKLPFTQKFEEGTAQAMEDVAKKAVETRPVQAGIEMYQGMTPEQKAYAEGAIGVSASALEMVGAGPGARVVSRGAEAVTNATKGVVRTGLSGIDDVTALLVREGVTEVGPKGIQQAASKGPGYAESLMQRVARISKGKQSAFEQTAKESVGTYLVKRGIFGTPDDIVDQLYSRMEMSKGRVDRAIQSVKGNHRAPSLKNALDELWERENKVGGVGMTSPDGLRIRELAKKHSNEGLTLSEVNEVKRLYERNVKLDYVQDINPVGLERAKRIDTALRTLVEEEAAKRGITVVRELNRETRLARQLADDLGAEFSGKAGNNLVGLTDWIMLAQSANNPTAAAGFMAKKFFGSEKVMSATAQLLARNKAIVKDLPVAGKANNQPPISGYAAFVEAHSDAFPDTRAHQSVQTTPATQKAQSLESSPLPATVPQPQPASIPQSTATRPGVQKSSSLPKSTTRPKHVVDAERFLEKMRSESPTGTGVNEYAKSIGKEKEFKEAMNIASAQMFRETGPVLPISSTDVAQLSTRPVSVTKSGGMVNATSKETFSEYAKREPNAIVYAYGKSYLGMNMERLQKLAKDTDFNLGEAMVRRVDAQETMPAKIDAIQEIHNELLDRAGMIKRLTRERGAIGKPSDEWLLAQAKRELAKTPNDAKLKAFVSEMELIQEAKKYKTVEEFVKKQPIVYHGTSQNLKQFNNRSGVFFTDDYMNADGYAGGENVFEGYLNLRKPLVIDAKGALHRELDTPFGNTTRDVVAKVDKEKYDGVIFKNIKDSWIDDAEVDTTSTIYYAFRPKDAFLNESQLIDIYNRAHGTTPKSTIQKIKDAVLPSKQQ